MANSNLSAVETQALVAELAGRENVEHARLLADMRSNVIAVGPVDVLLVRGDEAEGGE